MFSRNHKIVLPLEASYFIFQPTVHLPSRVNLEAKSRSIFPRRRSFPPSDRKCPCLFSSKTQLGNLLISWRHGKTRKPQVAPARDTSFKAETLMGIFFSQTKLGTKVTARIKQLSFFLTFPSYPQVSATGVVYSASTGKSMHSKVCLFVA